MQHLDEGTIHAWIDGALPGDEASRVDAHVASCAECAAIVAEARGLVAASSRIVSALDVTPGGVIPAFGAKRARPWWSVGTSIGAALAATLVIAVGYGVLRQPSIQTESTTRMDAVAPKTNTTSNVVAPLPPIAQEKAKHLLADRPATARSAGAGTVQAPRSAPLAEVTVTSIDSSRRTVVPLVADSLEVSERRRSTAIRNDSVRPAPPAPTPAPAPVADAVQRAQVSGAAMSAGAGGGGRGGRSQPAVSALNAFIPSSGVPARATFVGCYEADQSTDVLPRRFALRADSVAGNEVRYVDSTGVIAGRIADVDWIDAQGRAIIRSTGRGTILTIVRTPAGLGAQSSLGPRTVRVMPCK